MQKIAVFPGSFDPVTRGHEALVIKALPLFDEIIVAIGLNTQKRSMFSVEQRLEWLQTVFKEYPKVKTAQFTGLTIDFCKQVNATFILRGLRTSADFEFERCIGQVNRVLNPDVETVFLLTPPEYNSIHSSIVREIYSCGGDVSSLVPQSIFIQNR